jgi:hypothetical protein
MEATCSTETLVSFQRTTKHYIPEDIILDITGSPSQNDKRMKQMQVNGLFKEISLVTEYNKE